MIAAVRGRSNPEGLRDLAHALEYHGSSQGYLDDLPRKQLATLDPLRKYLPDDHPMALGEEVAS